MPRVSLEEEPSEPCRSWKTRNRVNKMQVAPSMRIGRAIAMIYEEVKGGEIAIDKVANFAPLRLAAAASSTSARFLYFRTLADFNINIMALAVASLAESLISVVAQVSPEEKVVFILALTDRRC